MFLPMSLDTYSVSDFLDGNREDKLVLTENGLKLKKI